MLALAGMLSACSSGDFAGSGRSSSKGEKSEEKESDQADEPQQVAGAFLINCAYIEEPAFGCTAVDRTTKAPFSKTDNTFAISLFNDAGDQVAMNTTPAPEASEFHVLGNLPEAYKDSGYLKMTVKPIKGQALAMEAKKPTKEIDELALGNAVEDYDFSFNDSAPAVAETLKLKSFQVTASWNGGALAMQAHTAVPANFCVGGTVNATLSADAQIMSDTLTGLFKSDDDPKGIGDVNKTIMALPSGTTVIGSKTSICFKNFSDSLFNGDRQLAHVGAGCVFVWAKIPQGEYLLIGRELQGDKKINVQDLRAFAQAKNESQGCN